MVSNFILYGKEESERTERFNQIISKSSERDKVIAISYEGTCDKTFKILKLEDLKDNFSIIMDNKRTFILINDGYDEKLLSDFFIYLIDNLISEKSLISINHAEKINIYKKIDDKYSILEYLLNMKNIKINLFLEDIKKLKSIYKNRFSNIITKFELECSTGIENFSGEIRLRLPKSLHKDLKIQTDRENISLNQYIVYALTKDIENQKFKRLMKERTEYE